MTAVIIAAQRQAGVIHIASDAAYYRNGIPEAFGQKVVPVAHWPGAIIAVGNGALPALLAVDLGQRFRTFDDLIEGAETTLPILVRAYGLPSGAELIFAGISESRGPEAYAVRTDDKPPLGMTAEEAESSAYWGDAPFALVNLGDLTMNPVPTDQVEAASYTGIDLDGDAETVVWGLRKIVEMQRHMTTLPTGICIGGFASVTTISRAGIATRMLQQWSEDRVGEPIRPAPIDWAQWHRDNPQPVATTTLAPATSRLRRDVDARKARKLRLVS